MKKTKIIPADRTLESIKNVVGIMIIGDNTGMGFCKTTSISLKGTIEEKLQQYKEAVGKDWVGFDEQTFTIDEKVPEPVSLNLGQTVPKASINKTDLKAQSDIDALTKQANVWLEEDKKAKKNRATQKEVEPLII
jgi:hypothetical protein